MLDPHPNPEPLWLELSGVVSGATLFEFWFWAEEDVL
jgi:hypothetical protein